MRTTSAARVMCNHSQHRFALFYLSRAGIYGLWWLKRLRAEAKGGRPLVGASCADVVYCNKLCASPLSASLQASGSSSLRPQNISDGSSSPTQTSHCL
eukprot:15084372-Alexandrium_andersonii.AAC.1